MSLTEKTQQSQLVNLRTGQQKLSNLRQREREKLRRKKEQRIRDMWNTNSLKTI